MKGVFKIHQGDKSNYTKEKVILLSINRRLYNCGYISKDEKDKIEMEILRAE